MRSGLGILRLRQTRGRARLRVLIKLDPVSSPKLDSQFNFFVSMELDLKLELAQLKFDFHV